MKLGIFLAALAASSLCSLEAQEYRYELGVSATGNFIRQSTGNGLTRTSDNSAGIGSSFRYWMTGRQGLDVSWSNFGATNYYSLNGAAIAGFNNRTNEATMSYVLRLPTFSAKIQPFVMAGGGALIQTQPEFATASYAASTVAKPTFTYGGGVDAYLTRHLGFRAQYKGFVVGDNDQGLSQFRTGATTHLAQPSAGFFWRF